MSAVRTLLRLQSSNRANLMTRRIIQKRKIVDNNIAEQDYKREYQIGEQGQFSYTLAKEYPKEWEPWRVSTDLSWAVYSSVAFLWLVYFMYERTYLEETGRQARDSQKKYFRS